MYAGRSELIQVVLQGTECYWLSILNVPGAVIDNIIHLCRLFLWNSNFSLVSWRSMCIPKNKGGLGLIDLRSWNIGLLSKILWNIHSKKDSLWVKWIGHQYLGTTSIWERERREDGSSLFKKLMCIRDSLLQDGGSPDGAMAIISGWIENGVFRSKATYDYFRLKGQRVKWFSVVWKSNLIPKQAFILWLCAKAKILANERFLFLNIDRSCPMCGTAEESLRHLFFQCHVSSDI